MPTTRPVHTETKQRLVDMLNQRICYVCGEHVPEPPRDCERFSDVPGVLHVGYRILVHRHPCLDIVTQEERIYDRSARGRWRPPAEVRARLRRLREGRHGDTAAQEDTRMSPTLLFPDRNTVIH